jgi:hypothetical protein
MQMDSLFYETKHINALDIVSLMQDNVTSLQDKCWTNHQVCVKRGLSSDGQTIISEASHGLC